MFYDNVFFYIAIIVWIGVFWVGINYLAKERTIKIQLVVVGGYFLATYVAIYVLSQIELARYWEATANGFEPDKLFLANAPETLIRLPLYCGTAVLLVAAFISWRENSKLRRNQDETRETRIPGGVINPNL